MNKITEEFAVENIYIKDNNIRLNTGMGYIDLDKIWCCENNINRGKSILYKVQHIRYCYGVNDKIMFKYFDIKGIKY